MAIARFRRGGRDRRRGRGRRRSAGGRANSRRRDRRGGRAAPGGLPWLRRNLAPLLKRAKRRPAPVVKPATPAPLGFPIRQALAKTITYRIIVTALDFSWNYVVIGEVAAAAGLSAITLAVAPVFYFVHEAAWEYSSAKAKRASRPDRASTRRMRQHQLVGLGGYSINRALAKTITFRTFATTTDFATNYAVVRDLPRAAMLTAFGFVVGPFVYLGHEMAWNRFGAPKRSASSLRPATR